MPAPQRIGTMVNAQTVKPDMNLEVYLEASSTMLALIAAKKLKDIKGGLAMLAELKKYKYIKKSNSELEIDKIIDNLTLKLWNDNGYSTIFYLGAINQLKVIAEGLRKYDSLGRDDILMLISAFKTNPDAPDEIKNLVDMILDECDYKE